MRPLRESEALSITGGSPGPIREFPHLDPFPPRPCPPPVLRPWPAPRPPFPPPFQPPRSLIRWISG